MKNWINIFCLFTFTSLLQSCIDNTHNKKLNGGYYLSAMDVEDDMEIIYKNEQDYMFTVVNATVFAVGQNHDFIIAKQHPKLSSSGTDKGVTNYFIIPVKSNIDQSPEKNIYGPLTLEEFEQKRAELNIEGLEFTIVIKDLE